MRSGTAQFVESAREVVGAGHLLTDVEDTGPYAVDWTRRWEGQTPAVVRPGDVAEVAELVRLARRHQVALVAQGGKTGLVGGSVPLGGEVVLSLARLTAIEPVDRLAGQVTVGAGVTLGALQQVAAGAGWAFGVDLAARDSATVGGMIATNAGGLHVLRHGAMRAQVIGVEAVLGTGAVVRRLTGLIKDNTGYDLAQLLCGSEGTLGIVTRARLRLVAPPGPLVVALLGLPSMTAAVAFAATLRTTLPGVRALEAMTGDGMRRTAGHLGVALPTTPTAGAFLLVEADPPSDDPTLTVADALTRAAGEGALSDGVENAAVATAARERAKLWRFREAQPEAAAALGVVHKMDVTLPASELAGFCDDVAVAIADRWPDATTFLYGHVGDGNVHVNVVGGPEGDGVDDLVLEQVVERGGSISAEHGIGTAKKRWLSRDRSPAEIESMRAVKQALDPDGILNPNVLFP